MGYSMMIRTQLTHSLPRTPLLVLCLKVGFISRCDGICIGAQQRAGGREENKWDLCSAGCAATTAQCVSSMEEKKEERGGGFMSRVSVARQPASNIFLLLFDRACLPSFLPFFPCERDPQPENSKPTLASACSQIISAKRNWNKKNGKRRAI